MLVSNVTYYYCIIASINVNYIFLVFIFFGKYYPIFWITNDIDNKRLNVSIIQRINDREKAKNYKIHLLDILNLQKLFATFLNYEKKLSVNNKPSPYLIVYLF